MSIVTSTPRAFAHVDLDQFFVSVERLLDPRLVGRPVIVGGSDPRARGAVACASYEARAHGVHAGMALRRAHALCPDAVFVPGSFAHYLERSRQVQALLEERVPRVIPRSIDEFDLDLTGTERLLGDPGALTEDLRAAIRARTGLSCSAGLAATPLVAKVAAAERKPGGFLRVPPGDEEAFLAPLPLHKLPGVGPRTEERLRELGLSTVGELARVDPALLQSALGARGAQLGERARGGAARLETGRAVILPFFAADTAAARREGGPGRAGQSRGGAPSDDAAGEDAGGEGAGRGPRSLSRERTFAEDQDDRRVLDAALVRLVEQAVAGLRVQGLRARCLAVRVRYADLRAVSRQARLPLDAEEQRVTALARRLLDRLLERRLRVRRLGVALSKLVVQHEQLQLFEGPRDRSRRALGQALDAIRTRHGFESVHFAAASGDGFAQRGATIAARHDATLGREG
ncbi:MAG: DNA polymerase IV [Planctomycetota bacterium]